MFRSIFTALAITMTTTGSYGIESTILNPTPKCEVVYYPDEYVQYKFIITKKEDGKYWGEQAEPIPNDGEGIYFEEGNILDSSDEINVGDIVIATFEAHNTEDGLVGVEKED